MFREQYTGKELHMIRILRTVETVDIRPRAINPTHDMNVVEDRQPTELFDLVTLI